MLELSVPIRMLAGLDAFEVGLKREALFLEQPAHGNAADIMALTAELRLQITQALL